MTKTILTIVGITSGALFIFYLYGMSKLGNKKDLNIFNNEPLFVSDDSRETIIGGTRKRKKRKRCSKKYLKNK